MSGMSTRNFKVFRHLCGNRTLANVAIVTSHWGLVDPKIGEARAIELSTKDEFFKPAIKLGAHFLRHYNTSESAQAIIRKLISNKPMPLLIQEELVDQQMTLEEAAAGAELQAELLEQQKRHDDKMRQLEKDTEDAIKRKDEQSRIEIEMERIKTREAQIKLQKAQDEFRKGCLRDRGLRRLGCWIGKFADEF
jgi:hypothetical protein